MEIVISVGAVLISIISIFISTYFSRKRLSTAVAPVLVFVFDIKSKTWVLQNVGNGPALNILVFEGDFLEWKQVVRSFPLGISASNSLNWVISPIRIAATYEDVHGRNYTSFCEEFYNKVTVRKKLYKPGDLPIQAPYDAESRVRNCRKTSHKWSDWEYYIEEKCYERSICEICNSEKWRFKIHRWEYIENDLERKRICKRCGIQEIYESSKGGWQEI